MASVMDARRRILLNTPHIETASGGVASFKTDMIAPLKGCKINFLPKQSGSGDPSPTNVRPISGWNGVSVTRCGKNLIDWSLYPFTDKCAFTPQSVAATAGEIAQNNYHCATLDFIPCKHLRGKSIIITPYQSSNNYASICFYETANESSYISAANHTAVVPVNASYMRFCIPRAYINDDKILEIGTDPTTYEPYTTSTFPVSWTQQGTVYGGYVDLVSGELWKTYEITDLGDIGWAKVTSYNHVIFYRSLYGGKKIDNFNGVCSQYKLSTDALYGADCTIRLYGSTVSASFSRCAIRDDSKAEMTTTEFKTAMSGVMLAYELDVPTLVGVLTPQQIKTLKGINNIYSNADSAEVKFWTH